MSIAYVNKSTQAFVDAATNTVTLNALAGVSAGNCLVVTASVFLGSTTSVAAPTVADAGGSYTVHVSSRGTAGTFMQYEIVAYRLNVGAGSFTPTITFTGATAGQTYGTGGVAEFSGVATSSAEDTWDANDAQTITTNDVNAGPITTTDAGDLIIGCGGVPADSSTSLAWSDPTSWTNLYRNNDGWTTATGHDSGYWLPGSIQTSYTPQWAHRNISGESASALVVALKPAAGAAAQATLIMPPMRAAGR